MSAFGVRLRAARWMSALVLLAVVCGGGLALRQAHHDGAARRAVLADPAAAAYASCVDGHGVVACGVRFDPAGASTFGTLAGRDLARGSRRLALPAGVLAVLAASLAGGIAATAGATGLVATVVAARGRRSGVIGSVASAARAAASWGAVWLLALGIIGLVVVAAAGDGAASAVAGIPAVVGLLMVALLAAAALSVVASSIALVLPGSPVASLSVWVIVGLAWGTGAVAWVALGTAAATVALLAITVRWRPLL